METKGKTKVITPVSIALIHNKDDITAGDGARHDVLHGKGALSTSTTCSMFELLRRRHVPVAYIGRGLTPTTFYAHNTKMIPIEVVVRRIATGSYLERYPGVEAGTRFDEPVVEFFYKTKDRKFKEKTLPCDDPLIALDESGKWSLYHAHLPLSEAYICPLGQEEDVWTLRQCKALALTVFAIIEREWAEQGGSLWDLKIEFGMLPTSGDIVVSDVIDCDSWRVWWYGLQLSKQPYRDGASLEEVLNMYRIANGLVSNML